MKNAQSLELWFDNRTNEAKAELAKLGFQAFMEARIHPSNLKIKGFTLGGLKSATKESTINTFGWPVAVFLPERKELSPLPTGEGIRARVSINGENQRDKRFNYWEIKSNGAFYLMESLFEDSRKENYLFFNTRIVRVAEVLLYAAKLYLNLGYKNNEKISIKITHSGLKERTIGVAGDRMLFREYKNYYADKISGEIETTIEDLNNNTAVLVEELVEPLFEVFDYFKVERNIIEDIVQNFKDGRVT